MASFDLTVEDSSPMISYNPQGAWVDTPENDSFSVSYSGRSFHTTAAQGATATIQFNGTGISIFGGNRPDYGTYAISVDGETTAKGDARGDIAMKKLLGSVSGLTNGPHTAVLTNTGGAPVDIDWVDLSTQVGITGSKMSTLTYDDSDPSIRYLPSDSDWKTNTGTNFMDGTLHYSQTPAASASLSFTGSAVAVYGTVSPDHANIQVVLDGQTKTFTGGSNGFSTSLHSQVLLYYANDLGPTPHTLIIAGDHSQGAGPFVDIDSVTVFSIVSPSAGTPGGLAPSNIPSTGPTGNSQPEAASGQPSGFISRKVIIGAVVGGVIGLLLLLTLFAFIWRRWRSRVDGSTIRSPITPVLPMQGEPNMMEAGYSRSQVKPGVRFDVPETPYDRHSITPSYYGDPNFATDYIRRPSMASLLSETSSKASTMPMIRNIPIVRVPQPPGRAYAPTAGSDHVVGAPTRPNQRPPSLDFESYDGRRAF